jgi:precorrin-6B methylase 2
LDLTGGYGVDTYFLSELFSHTDYVEQNAELCRIATHNFAAKPITIHHSTAEDFLASAGQYDLIFLDPARRDSYGGKVFRLEDCTPNVVELLPALLTHGKRIMIKLSPMLDITQAVTTLSQVTWDIYVVAIKNEVKEVLLLSGGSGRITAIDLSKKEQAFTFTREEEINSEAINVRSTINSEAINYLYEPNAAILKAGAYKLVAQRFGLRKLDVNTHIYTSETLVPDFPGRVFKVLPLGEGMGVGPQANVLVRNYPLTAEQLKKKLHLRDGGTAYVIGCRVAGKPTIFLADRLQ